MHGLSILTSSRLFEREKTFFSFVVLVFSLTFGQALFAQEIKTSAQPLNSTSIESLSIEQKVGQTMIWSFQGREIDADFESMLSRYQPGALIIFKRNIKSPAQIGKLNYDLQKLASRRMKAPLFLMVDQEGGVVTRVKISTPIPSALALGRTDDPQLIGEFAKTQAELLQALNFNVNLAPVLDLSNPSKPSFIGNRTFGDDPDQVSNLGMAYSKGMSANGLMPTAKHFPGHGNLTADSHKSSASKNSTEEELENRDLIPFKQFASGTFPKSVMMAHMSVPQLDPSGLPATYSTVIIEDLLRKKMKFDGLVMTDDLEMSGAAGIQDIGERTVRAFLAGNDMMILAGQFPRQRKAYRAMIDAVKSGRISEERLNASVRRILEAKAKMAIKAAPMDRAKALAAIKKLETLSKDVMNKNFKFALEEFRGVWPTLAEGKRVAVFSSSGGFYRTFKQGYAGRTRIYPLNPNTLDGVPQELSKDSVGFGVFYASGKRSARYLSELSPALRSKLIVVNCNEPGSVDQQESFMAVLNLNSHSPESGEWLAETLSRPKAEDSFAPDIIRTPTGDKAVEEP